MSIPMWRITGPKLQGPSRTTYYADHLPLFIIAAGVLFIGFLAAVGK